MGLGAEGKLRHAPPARLVDQGLQQGRADALAPPARQHRHPPDVTVGQQAAGAHRLAVNQRQRVARQRVELVELHLGRHLLLLHEHLEADRPGLGGQLGPAPQAHHQRRRAHARMSTAVPAGTSSKSSATSRLRIRTQPMDRGTPIGSVSGVPWM